MKATADILRNEFGEGIEVLEESNAPEHMVHTVNPQGLHQIMRIVDDRVEWWVVCYEDDTLSKYLPD